MNVDITVSLQDITYLGWEAALLMGLQKTLPRTGFYYAALEHVIELFTFNSRLEVIQELQKYVRMSEQANVVHHEEYTNILKEFLVILDNEVPHYPDYDTCKALVELRIRFWCPVCLREIKVTYSPPELQEMQYLYYRHWKPNTRERCMIGRFMIAYSHPDVTVKIWEPYLEQ